MKKLLSNREHLRVWWAIVGTGTIVLIAAFTLVQQSTRLAANDQPFSTAQTVKHELDSGAQPSDVIPTMKTDLRSDSSVFITVTDNAEHILASSATLDGQPSLPPAGTFAYTKTHDSDHFTWQPKSGVRLATYIQRYGVSPNDGFIITGQSLDQAEDRIQTYTWLTLAAWFAMIIWSSLFLLTSKSASNPKKLSSRK